MYEVVVIRKINTQAKRSNKIFVLPTSDSALEIQVYRPRVSQYYVYNTTLTH